MEKFSKWRDPGSGIQPFLPFKKTTDEDVSHLYLVLNNFLLGPLLGTLKLFLLLPLLMLWFTLIWILMSFQIPFAVLRVFDTIFGGFSLALMGFYSLPRKRMIIRPAIAAVARPYESFSLHSEKVSHASDSVQPGDWIISNLTSYCDLICGWFYYSGVVTILADAKSGNLRACPNRFQAFYHYTLGTLRTVSASADGNNSVSVANYPVIIFPEGVTSNGRGVLKFVANLSSAKRNQRLHLTCTKFHSALFNPTFPGPPTLFSFFAHLWQLCSQLQNTLTIRTILPAALFSSNFDLPVAAENPVQYNRTLQQIIAALGHLRALNLGAEDKCTFLKAFNEKNE